MIKAIETQYNGYRFRSRLEARWAVFFDTANIRYQYEPEGFVLHDGTRYLPDFYLPDFEIYVEIKPFNNKIVQYVGDNNEWEQTCRKFRDTTGKAILLCYGDPSEHYYKRLFAWDISDSSGGSSEWFALFSVYHEKVLLCVYSWSDHFIYINDSFEANKYVKTSSQYEDDYLLWDRSINLNYPDCINWDDPLNKAKKAARQARFEYGEVGA